MKYLLILAAFLSSAALAKDAKFRKGERVSYEVPKFYSKVCTGFGLINDLIAEPTEKKEAIYEIETAFSETGCPLRWAFQESKLKLAEEQK